VAVSYLTLRHHDPERVQQNATPMLSRHLQRYAIHAEPRLHGGHLADEHANDVQVDVPIRKPSVYSVGPTALGISIPCT
jgi:hypothetical protein